jgi:hypothetical protein
MARRWPSCCSCRSRFGQPSGRLWRRWPRPCCNSALNQPQKPLSHQPLTSSRSWRVRKGQPGFNCFWHAHLTETTDRPFAPHPRYAPLSKGDRVFLYPAHIDIPPDLGSPVVKDDFEVKSTAGCIVYICPYKTGWRQELSTQKIDVPKLGADARDVNFYNSHPRVIGEFDPLIERRGGRPGGGL